MAILGFQNKKMPDTSYMKHHELAAFDNRSIKNSIKLAERLDHGEKNYRLFFDLLDFEGHNSFFDLASFNIFVDNQLTSVGRRGKRRRERTTQL